MFFIILYSCSSSRYYELGQDCFIFEAAYFDPSLEALSSRMMEYHSFILSTLHLSAISKLTLLFEDFMLMQQAKTTIPQGNSS